MQSFLEHIKTIHRLSPASEEALTELSREMKVSSGEHLQTIGEVSRTIYFVKKGLVRIYYYKDSIEITENFEFENSFVTGGESLITGVPSNKAIQVIENSILIAIDGKRLFNLFDTHQDLERLFRKIIEISYVKSINRIESLQFNNAESRYLNLIKSQPDILRRIPLKFIATYIGITQVSLSRIRANR